MNLIKLAPYNAITGKYVNQKANVYIEYSKWRKSEDYKPWMKRQWAKQHGKCYWCNKELRGRRVNVEHVLARSKGGDNSKGNLVLSCAPCNKKKGSTKVSNQVIRETKRFNRARFDPIIDPIYRELSWLRTEYILSNAIIQA